MLKLNSLSGFGSGVSGGAVGTNGYWQGGEYAGLHRIADRVVYATGIGAAHTDADLSDIAADGASISDCITYGYSTLGYYGDPATRSGASDRLTFATGINAAHSDGNTVVGRSTYGAMSDGSTYGYNAGGSSGSGSKMDDCDRITFSTGVSASYTDGNLVVGVIRDNQLSDKSTYGYHQGGHADGGGHVALGYRRTFSTGAVAAHTDADASTDCYFSVYLNANLIYGYLYDDAFEDRMVFATGVNSVHTDAGQVRRSSGARANTDTTYGYIAGGYAGSWPTETLRLTISTETLAAHTDADISMARAGISSMSDGWV